MSKAFTRESDDAPEPRPQARAVSGLPPGTKNYMTASGARRLQEELKRLVEVERPPISSGAEKVEARHRLQVLDQKILRLQESIQSAVIVEPPPKPWEQVRFGATVSVRDGCGNESSYRIVGVDEIDIDQNWASWISPIAKALLNARRGETVRFKFPSGEAEFEIMNINYE